jgi:hypothetical protein
VQAFELLYTIHHSSRRLRSGTPVIGRSPGLREGISAHCCAIVARHNAGDKVSVNDGSPTGFGGKTATGREAPLHQLSEERLQLLEAADAAGFFCYHLTRPFQALSVPRPSPCRR